MKPGSGESIYGLEAFRFRWFIFIFKKCIYELPFKLTVAIIIMIIIINRLNIIVWLFSREGVSVRRRSWSRYMYIF